MTLEGAPVPEAEHYNVLIAANPAGKNWQRYLSVDSHIT